MGRSQELLRIQSPVLGSPSQWSAQTERISPVPWGREHCSSRRLQLSCLPELLRTLAETQPLEELRPHQKCCGVQRMLCSPPYCLPTSSCTFTGEHGQLQTLFQKESQREQAGAQGQGPCRRLQLGHHNYSKKQTQLTPRWSNIRAHS